MPYRARLCQVCNMEFTPPHRSTLISTGDNHLYLCAQCRRAVKDADAKTPAPADTPESHKSAAPLKQVVFDLETWGLDRGWGVTMVASFLFHGNPDWKWATLTLRGFQPWAEGRRSDDRDLAAEIFRLLDTCHIAYAHNGEYFDLRWLRTVALRYSLRMPRLKLIDPAALARQKYRIGRNSLEALGDFLEIPHKKIHLAPNVWRAALLDDDDEAWGQLGERCEADVRLLNAVAARVTGDVGMVDYSGSWR